MEKFFSSLSGVVFVGVVLLKSLLSEVVFNPDLWKLPDDLVNRKRAALQIT